MSIYLKLENITADKKTLLEGYTPDDGICLLWSTAKSIWYAVLETEEDLEKFLTTARRYCETSVVTERVIEELYLSQEISWYIRTGKISLLLFS